MFEPDITVIGEASSGEQALELVKSLAPDIVLMDVEMPGMDSLPNYKLRYVHSEPISSVTKERKKESLHWPYDKSVVRVSPLLYRRASAYASGNEGEKRSTDAKHEH
jgi:AmiR/NasT family two-component response regulator